YELIARAYVSVHGNDTAAINPAANRINLYNSRSCEEALMSGHGNLACFGIATLLLTSQLASAQPSVQLPTLLIIPCAGGSQRIDGHQIPATLPRLRVDATAINAFTVRITWTGRVGSEYSIREIGGSYRSTVHVAPIQSLPGQPSTSITSTTQRPVFATHEQALPGSSHAYEIREQSHDGAQPVQPVCGTATATTPAPPLLAVSGQYVDPHHVTVT